LTILKLIDNIILEKIKYKVFTNNLKTNIIYT